MIQDILVHVDNSDSCAARLDIAMALAKAHGARLRGVLVRSYPKVPRWVVLQMGADVVEVQKRFEAEAARKAEEMFQQAIERNGAEAGWCEVDGGVVDAVVRLGRYADLIVLGRTSDEALDDDQRKFIVHAVLEAGRPVLMLPPGFSGPPPGRSVLIAWDGSREATRAVHDAMPLLDAAEIVRIAEIVPKRKDKGDICQDTPAKALAAHLHRHGINAEPMEREGADAEVGGRLVDCIGESNADLVVMGAYGRSRLRELVLGGATRHLMKNATVPLLLSH